jgi:O-antigen ligase
VAASRRRWRWAALLAALAARVAGALVQTQTRAPLVAFAVAIVAMVALRGGSPKRLAVAAVVAALVVAAGAWFITHGREVSLLNPTDESTAWRLTVWREALPLVAEHPLFGIGPDAATPEWTELKLGEGGRLPRGHLHSTPLQIAVDRGIPALVAWAAMMATFFVSAGRLVRRLGAREGGGLDWRVTAAALGAWGAVVGFVASSFVHFNWGDSEPMEMAWCLMGIVFAIARLTPPEEEARELR